VPYTHGAGGRRVPAQRASSPSALEAESGQETATAHRDPVCRIARSPGSLQGGQEICDERCKGTMEAAEEERPEAYARYVTLSLATVVVSGGAMPTNRG
jgi:hypothetical protein